MAFGLEFCGSRAEPQPILVKQPTKPVYIPDAPLPPAKYAATDIQEPKILEEEVEPVDDLPEIFKQTEPKTVTDRKSGFRWFMMVPTAAAIAG